MKKLLSMVALLGLGFWFAGCAEEKKGAAPPKPGGTIAEKPGDKIDIGKSGTDKPAEGAKADADKPDADAKDKVEGEKPDADEDKKTE